MKNDRLLPGVLVCIGAAVLLFSCGPRTETPARGKPAAPPSPLHPSFTLTLDGLSPLLRGLPDEIGRRILERPEAFLDLLAKIIEDPSGLVVLVDKKNPLPEEYEPKDLVNLRDYPLRLSRRNLTLREVVIPDLLAMAEAAREAGVELLFSSTYRSYAYQKTVYERIVRELGREAADRESARPGHSQHQLGTAVDFGSISDAFTGTPMQRWLAENAGKFGFSLSYPEGYEELTGYRHESWHYRYIGRAAAEMERDFFGGIQQHLMQFLHEKGEDLRAALVKGRR